MATVYMYMDVDVSARRTNPRDHAWLQYTCTWMCTCQPAGQTRGTMHGYSIHVHGCVRVSPPDKPEGPCMATVYMYMDVYVSARRTNPRDHAWLQYTCTWMCMCQPAGQTRGTMHGYSIHVHGCVCVSPPDKPEGPCMATVYMYMDVYVSARRTNPRDHAWLQYTCTWMCMCQPAGQTRGTMHGYSIHVHGCVCVSPPDKPEGPCMATVYMYMDVYVSARRTNPRDHAWLQYTCTWMCMCQPAGQTRGTMHGYSIHVHGCGCVSPPDKPEGPCMATVYMYMDVYVSARRTNPRDHAWLQYTCTWMCTCQPAGQTRGTMHGYSIHVHGCVCVSPPDKPEGPCMATVYMYMDVYVSARRTNPRDHAWLQYTCTWMCMCQPAGQTRGTMHGYSIHVHGCVCVSPPDKPEGPCMATVYMYMDVYVSARRTNPRDHAWLQYTCTWMCMCQPAGQTRGTMHGYSIHVHGCVCVSPPDKPEGPCMATVYMYMDVYVSARRTNPRDHAWLQYTCTWMCMCQPAGQTRGTMHGYSIHVHGCVRVRDREAGTHAGGGTYLLPWSDWQRGRRRRERRQLWF